MFVFNSFVWLLVILLLQLCSDDLAAAEHFVHLYGFLPLCIVECSPDTLVASELIVDVLSRACDDMSCRLADIAFFTKWTV